MYPIDRCGDACRIVGHQLLENLRHFEPLDSQRRADTWNPGSPAFKHLALDAGPVAEWGDRDTHSVKDLSKVLHVAGRDHAIAAQVGEFSRKLAADQKTLDRRMALPHQWHDLTNQPASCVTVWLVAEAADEGHAVPPRNRNRGGSYRNSPQNGVDFCNADLLAQHLPLIRGVRDDDVGGGG